VVPYEIARALLGGASQERDLFKRDAQLEEARAQLEAFLRASPDHPLSAEANRQFGNILLERGRVAVSQSRSPTKKGSTRELQQQARELFQQARDVFQTAHDKYQAQWKRFPPFVDPVRDKPQYEAKAAAERHYVQAQLNLAQVEYELAQSYESGSPQWRQQLEKAADAFPQVNARYRTMLAGLYARMWQGKCFQELGDIQKALGLYNELLDQDPNQGDPSTRAELKKLHDMVRHFRLICLNDESRADYQLVVEEAEQWRGQNRASLRTDMGLGISWELVRAYEGLGKAAGADSPAGRQWFQKALVLANEIVRYQSQYRPAALAVGQRLAGRVGGVEVRDFDGAMSLARAALDEALEAEREAAGAAAAGAEGPAAKSADKFAEAANLYRRALDLAEADTPIERVNEARYLLAFASYKIGRSYDAAVLGQFVARNYPDSGLALNAAYIAMVAYVQAYNASPEATRGVDLGFMTELADLITERWPESPEADQARMTLGYIATQRGEPLAAAQWYGAVPEGSDKYVDAQQKAGMALWQGYLDAAKVPPSERPSAERLAELQQKAQEHLAKGISHMRSRLAGREPPLVLLASELSLAQIYIAASKYDAALPLLEPLIALVDSRSRPDVTDNATFTRETYKAALRAYVGARDLDKAEQMMARLESLETDDASLVQIYRELGAELESEVNRRRELGDQSGLADMLASFEEFLDRIFRRQQGQTFQTLQWIGDAYARLAEGLDVESAAAADRSRAAEYFGRAATAFQEILERSRADAAFAPDAKALDHVRLRVVTCRRKQGQYREALVRLGEILANSPRNVEAQIEGAAIYRDWAQFDPAHWDEALYGGLPGPDGGKLIWGWGRLAQLLQPAARKGTPYYALWHEARYNQAYCRYKQALSQVDAQQRQKLLQLAAQDVRFTASLTDDHGGPEWHEKLDRLLRTIQQAMGERVEGLAAPEATVRGSVQR
ncbi:MAG: tetratricopeptide repeat protein, partial [Pirellulales bacterium]